MQSFGSVASLQPTVPSQQSASGRVSLEVVVLHGDELVRCGLESMIRSLPEVQQVRSAAPGHALKLIKALPPDLLLLPTSIPPEDWSELAETTTQGGGRVLALLRSPEASADLRPDCLEADGFLTEEGLTAKYLASAFHRLGDGEMPVPTALLRRLLAASRTGVSQSTTQNLPQLTPRENATLALLVDGLSNKQIARRLSISEHGAKRHVANVLAKLNCPNRTVAVARAVRDGLVEVAS